MPPARDSGSAAALILAWVNDEASRKAIESVAVEHASAASRVFSGSAVDAAEQLRQQASPTYLIVEVASAETAPKQLDALAEVVDPNTKVIVTGKMDSYRFYAWLMELGIHDYLLQPITAEALRATLAKDATKQAEAPAIQPKLVAFIGARGGVGTTTIATNLAALIAREYHVATALVDPDVHFGSVALGLDLEPVRGLKDALEKPDRVDALFLERVMVKPFANVSILSAEEPLRESVATEAGATSALAGALHEQFPLVMVDVPRHITPLHQDMLSQADHVVLVIEPSVLNLRDALRIKDYLTETLKRPAPLLVVSKRGEAPAFELSKADLSKHYGAPPLLELPYLVEAQAALSRGEVLLDQPKAKHWVEALQTLATRVTGATAAPVATEKQDPLSALLGKLRLKGT